MPDPVKSFTRPNVSPDQINQTIAIMVNHLPLDPGEGFKGECQMFKSGFGNNAFAVCRGACEGQGKHCTLALTYDAGTKTLTVECRCLQSAAHPPAAPEPLPPKPPNAPPVPQPPLPPKPSAPPPPTTVKPVDCPCPVGILAEITITKLGFTLVEKTKVFSGRMTANSEELAERSLDIDYDFKQKDMGMLSDGSVTVKYKLTLYYAEPKKANCCESGTLKFDGDVVFNATKSSIFGSPTIVNNAKAPVHKTDTFGTCPPEATPECTKQFDGDYDEAFSFDIPTWAPLPSWKGSIRIDGKFQVEVATKKQH